MKRIILIMAIILIATPCFGQATSVNINLRPDTYWWQGGTSDIGWRWMKEMDAKVAGLGGGASGTGKNWYVDSGVANEGDGSNWLNAFDTVDEAINAISTDSGAERGDWIHVAEYHGETYTAADGFDADVAAVTIKGYGYGDSRPTFTLNHANANVAIGDSGVVLYNLRFVSSITAVDDGINVEAAADDCAILNCEFPEPAASASEVIRMIIVASGADRLLVQGCTAYSCDATGATNFIDLDTGVQKGTRIIGNYIHGEYAEGPIHTDDADEELFIAYNIVTNMTTGEHGIEIAGNATGWLIGNRVSTDAVGTSYDVGYVEDGGGNLWDDYGTYDTSAVPWTTNETGVNRWGASELAQMEAEATDAIEGDFLDKLAAATVADEIVDASFLADLTTTGSDWSDFVASTDSLQAISDKITALTGYIHAGTNSAATSTTPIVAALIGYGEDYFNTDWVMVVLLNADSAGAAPEGDVRDITNYVTATGTFTIDATSAALANNDIVMVARKEDFILAGIAAGTGAYPTGVVNDSILAMILGKGAEASASTYVNSTDSLEMISDKLGAFAGTAGAAANESLKADIALIQTDLGTIETDTAAMDDATGMQGLTGTAAVSTTGVTGAPTANTLADTLHKDGNFTYDNTTDALEAIADEQEYSMTVTRTKGGGIDLVSGTNNLFVVSGPVEVTVLTGVVAQTLKTVANACKFIHTTTVPAGSVDLTSALECNADAAGTSYTLNTTVGAAMIATTAGTVATSTCVQFLAPAGTIGFNAAGTFDAGDSIVFYVKYKPLISGARLTASP